jgi:predicted nucleotide-binding protein
LQKPYEEAKALLQKQLQRGTELRNRTIENPESLQDVRGERYRWIDYVATLLQSLFDQSGPSDEFTWTSPIAVFAAPDFHRDVREFREDMKSSESRLQSIIERLELFECAAAQPRSGGRQVGNGVFVVHGHDTAVKEAVARFVQSLGLQPIILHDQANQGNTIIEKFEEYSNASFAVVLLTPDDLGASAATPTSLNSRARQNVVFELGYFIGKLGRDRVCALKSGDVEVPSDVAGIAYVSWDGAGGWKLTLARELKAAGLCIDPSALLS